MKSFVVLINLVLCFSLVYPQVETRTDSEESLFGYGDILSDRQEYSKKSVAALLAHDGSEIYPRMSNDGPFSNFQYRQPHYSSAAFRKQFAQRSQFQSFEPRDGTPHTREVAVKQGRLKGIVRVMHPQSGLKSVDQYLGIPYAEAPVGSRRFMPPSAPIPWTGLKMAIKMSPVCPQNLPTLSHKNNSYSKGRYDQLKRLLPYLKDESEDCLYLNLYVPSYDGIGPQGKYPVIVYIHGESYEWNSGNPYDGSILATYGRVIVVTLNFRLGILGFMKPGISDHTTSNFGLLDQIAALQWIKENIGAFGGDNKLVTVMGHGTGAACVNFLMVSPVAKGLFHRAILLSGSALSDWALTQHPLQSTMQVLQGLNCPMNGDNEEVTTCLRRKRYSEILNVKIGSPQFSTRFGPIVDGLVIPNTPHKVMGQYSDIFSGYDLLFGMTELESYNELNAVALTYGLLENERDNLLRFYMQNRFEMRPDLALASTLHEYTKPAYPNKSQADTNRDTLLDILSDARVASPMVQTGLYLAKVNPKCYMYVFAHNSEAGEYGQLVQSVVGEDLAYIFGAPLGPVGPFQTHYNAHERLFSEAVMKYFSNFAQTGNPKAPWKDLFLNMNPEDWRYYDVEWPEFNSVNQSFLHLGLTPVASRHYRQEYMKFWNQKLPDELKRITTTLPFSPYADFISPPERRITTSRPDFVTGHINMYPIKVDIEKPTEDSFKALVYRMKDSHAGSPGMYNAAASSIDMPAEAPVKEKPKPANDERETENSDMMKTEASLTVLIAVAIVFLVFNIFVVVGYVIKRNIGNKKMKRKFDDNILESAASMNEKRSKLNETEDSYIIDMIRKSNPYEPVVKVNNFTLPRQFSGETVDPHTKVCDWIAQDYGVCPGQPECDGAASNSSCNKELLNSPQKVSVAIDATPQARGNSVLRQEPIEITKAKSFEYASPEDYEESVSQNSPCESDARQQCSSSGSSYSYNDCDYKIEPKHLRPEMNPVYNNYPYHGEEITSFIEPGDINVTSRDKSEEKDPLSPEEALKVIQRRNFPKVLPDYPNGVAGATASMKRRSLPPQAFMLTNSNSLRRDLSRLVPAPPPRISSTLGRRASKHRTSNNFLSSPPMMAEEPPIEEEPPITQNTLHVGPLLPKHQENTYMTMSRQNSVETDQSAPSEEPAVDIICIEHKPESHYSYIKPPCTIKPPTSFKSSPSKDVSRSESKSELAIHPSGSISRLPVSRSNSSTIQRELSSDSSATDTTSSSTGTIKQL